MGTQRQQCVDGEWTSTPPICELIQEAPKPAELELEKAFVSSGLFSVLFTLVPPGFICNAFEWADLGLFVEWDS